MTGTERNTERESDEGWAKQQKLVLYVLEQHTKEIREFKSKMDSIKDSLDELKLSVARMGVKTAFLWAAVGAAVMAGVGAIVMKLIH